MMVVFKEFYQKPTGLPDQHDRATNYMHEHHAYPHQLNVIFHIYDILFVGLIFSQHLPPVLLDWSKPTTNTTKQ